MIDRLMRVVGCAAGVLAAGCAGPANESEPPIRAGAGDSAEDDAPERDAGSFRVRLATSQGDVIIEVHPDWAPRGAARFRELVQAGFYDGARFFRVLDGFMAQAGIAADPDVHARWDKRTIKDDPVVKSNTRGYVTYAKSGLPDSRSTQFFINYGNNSRLDADDFAPFGKVVEGLDVVEKFYSGYGEGAPNGRGPSQQRIVAEGNEYLNKQFPRLDYIEKATIIEEPKGDEPEDSKSNKDEGASNVDESASSLE